MINAFVKKDSLFVKTHKQNYMLIYHIVLRRITIKNPEEMPTVFEQ